MSLSALCQQCGLCCDGTLFARVPVTPSEAERLGILGIRTGTREDGSPVLPQRCGALKGRCCTAYEARPQTCRHYVCQLGTALQEGEVDFEEATAVVRGAHERMMALCCAAFGDDDWETLADRLRACAADGDSRLEQQNVRDASTRLEQYLDRHLRGRSRGR